MVRSFESLAGGEAELDTPFQASIECALKEVDI